ncbi:MAG: CDP-diacylglycerol diphosphatase [Pelomonas sp.]|nr:CDP-diacylglycerol diphosphatase [Roseateles sp.]
MPFPSISGAARSLRAVGAALLLLAAARAAHADRNALWQIIDTQCVPEAQAGAAPRPCARVQLAPDREHGWVLLKDRNGVLQYLLMPSARVPGIESPLLEQPDAPNYFAAAWRARDLLDALNVSHHGAALPRDAVSLTVNSIRRRSQDQLHIHISCVQPELRARLLAAQDEIGPAWAPLPGGWLRHAWFVRRVEAKALDGVNPFVDAAAHVPGAGADMSRATLGVVGVRFSDGVDGFVLMASLFDPADPSSGTAEGDIQDHDCAIVRPPAAPVVP